MIEKQNLLAALPQRRQSFKSAGHQWTRVVRLRETWLVDHYVMVRVRFLMGFEKAAGHPVDFETESTSILYIQDGTPRIVFHLESEDVQQALQARGLLGL